MNSTNNNSKQSKLSSFFSPPSSISKKSSQPSNFSSDGSANLPNKRVKSEVVRVISSSNDEHTVGRRNESVHHSRFQQCIICSKSIPHHHLIRHVSNCNGNDNEYTNHNDINALSFPRKSKRKVCQIDSNSNSRNQGRFSICPICNKSIPYYELNRHAQSCNVSETDEQRPKLEVSVPSCNENVDNINISPTNHTLDKSNLSDRVSQTISTKEDESQQWRKLIKDVSRNNIEYQSKTTSQPLPGLYLFENFITDEEESTIIQYLDSSDRNQVDWKYATFNGRHVGKRWGVHCNLRDRRVYHEENPLPPFISNLIIPKLRRIECMKDCIPNEANAISYERKRGDFLKSHVDDRQLSKEALANLSLAGDCLMTFIHEKKNKTRRLQNANVRLPDVKKVLLKRRTLQVLTGCARYDYSHGIANEDLISDRRISLTMRQSPLSK